ncbi:MAG TPA: Fur family transcriptional regulator [Verrucomicrobiae bacterium]|nr:Fur family transcriptional regulator [Verrucomicrobiae bacterium]
MKNNSGKASENSLTERLAARGFRSTSQRQHVYDVLAGQRDHPTAEQVFLRAKKGMPEISMATVYNCLDTLVKSGLVREVNVDSSAMRYCPNMEEHCHFYCDACGEVYDIHFNGTAGVELPKGFQASAFELAIHGACPKCAKKQVR